MNDFKYLKYEENENIGTLTINREDKLNALNPDVIRELDTFLEQLMKAHDPTYAGLIITGAGEKSFVAGADIGSMTEMSPAEAVEFAYSGQKVTTMLESLPFPVIAAVNGFALGGGFELALSCDFIFAAENALFGLPEVSLGLIPGFGGTQRLTRLVGRYNARKFIYSGEKIKIDQAKDLQIVCEAFSNKDELIQGCRSYLEKVKRNSPFAVGIAKAAINSGADINLPEGLSIEREQFGDIFNSQDMKEGCTAFVEKRKANFTGR